MNYTKEQRMMAAKVDLLEYMNNVHPDKIKKEGKAYARFLGKRSVSLSSKGYYDNSDKKSGNSIDFLKTFLGKESIVDAVLELYNYAISHSSEFSADRVTEEYNVDYADTKSRIEEDENQNDSDSASYQMPHIIPDEEKNAAVHRYLENHGISDDEETVFAACYKNCEDTLALFISRETNYWLVKGIDEVVSGFDYYDIPLPVSEKDGYYITGSKLPDTIYVCESLLATLSLRELHRINGDGSNAAYASIAREKNLNALKRLIKNHPNVRIVIAFDNDEEGYAAAFKLPYDFIKPAEGFKNWNEQLLAIRLYTE